MTSIFHVLTGEFPPARGGVGDYTRLIAHALAARGCSVHVWCPSVPRADRDGSVEVHALPDTFGPRSRSTLEAAFSARPGCVLLQYVPNVLGARGANLRFCVWLRGLRRRNVDVRVMFHEPYFYFAWRHPLGNILALTQRVMARVLLQAGRVAYLSTEAWVRYLQPFAPVTTELIVTPIPSTIDGVADPDAVAEWRRRFGEAPVVGHFGTFGDHLTAELEQVIPAVLGSDPQIKFVCIGRRSEAFVAAQTRSQPAFAERLLATGALQPADVAAALRACDLLVQPYPDGVTTRRTSVMAGLANQVATIATDGFLTEPVWRTSGALSLVPAGDADAVAGRVLTLLRDRQARAALAQAGRAAYAEQFAIERTVDRLIAPAVAVS